MKKFFSFIIRQSVAVVLITVFVLGFGIFSTSKMAINLLPDINVPVICIQNIYAGANAKSVEADVTAAVEEGLSSLSGVTEVLSYSYDNLSAVALMFDYGTDTDGKKNEIQSKLAGISLPDGVQTSVYDLDLNAAALAVLSLTSNRGETDGEKLKNAYNAADALAAKLSAIDGVETVEIKGAPARNIIIKPYGGLELAVPLFVEAFSYGSLNLPLGNITGENGDVQIRNDTDITSMADILNTPVTLPDSLVSLLRTVRENIAQQLLSGGYDISTPEGAKIVAGNSLLMAIIKSGLDSNEQSRDLKISVELLKFIILTQFPDSGGLTVKVGDVATAEYENKFSSYVYFAGGGAKLVSGTVIEISKSNGANAAAVVRAVKDVYNAFLAESGEQYGAQIKLLDDQSEFISDSVSNVLVSMIIGGVLAIAVIFVFLRRVKTSLIIAVTMPLSVLAALICLYLMGITLNMVSLGGLAVGIGMLVDNSIVVIESISKHRDMGKNAFEAAVDGTVEVGGALFGSTLTTVCVFIPIIFSGGLTGEIFTELSFAVIFSLAFSLIIAVSVIPAFYAMFTGKKRMLKGGGLTPEAAKCNEIDEQAATLAAAAPSNEIVFADKKTKPRKKLEVMNSVCAFYGKILPKILSKKLVTVLVAVAVFAVSIGLLFITGTEFLPSIDKGQIEVNMIFKDGISLEEKQADVYAFAGVLLENVENVDHISVNVGKNGMLAFNDTGVITVQLNTDRGTEKVVEHIRALAKDERYKPLGNPNVRQIDGVVASLTSGTDEMSVTVTGNDNDELRIISGKICEKLSENGFEDIHNSALSTVEEYDLKFDRYKMEKLGIDYKTLILTLRIGIASYTACTVTLDGQSYNVNVKFADGAVEDIDGLTSLVVGSQGTEPVKLGDICETTKISAEACIRRSNGRRMVSVSATLPGADMGGASRKMQKIAADVLKDYENYSFASTGVSSYLTDAFEGLAVALVISFFLLYAVMAVQFGSALKPLIIMASIPFSFTGGFIALVITGTSLNVVSFIGLIMLMGVVVNNAIVMLEKIKQLTDAGVEHFTAVTQACKVRLRPILMTTLTTVLALIPMAIGVGSGSELMQPLGIVVIGGLLLGTLVTLFIVPTVYCAVHRLKAPEKRV